MNELSHTEAVRIVALAFEDERYTHPQLQTACTMAGTSIAELRKFRREARQVTGKRCRLEICTPTGSGARR